MKATFALDVGTRRTGVAFLDPRVGFPLPLETVKHQSPEDLLARIVELGAARSCTDAIVGLPLLPSGVEGSQAALVRAFATLLEEKGWSVTFRDERYTTLKRTSSDGDARAALALFSMQK